MKNLMILFSLLAAVALTAQTPTYSIVSNPPGFYLDCNTQTINISFLSGGIPMTVTCTGSASFNVIGDTIPVSTPGTYTIYNGTITFPFTTLSNTATPVFSQSPSIAYVSAGTVTLTAISPTDNITQTVLPPQGGLFTTNNPTVTYMPPSAGTFTHCVKNNHTGCKACSEFTIALNTGTDAFTRLKDGISVYPNPANEFITLEKLDNLQATVNAEIFNSLGQLVYSKELDDTRGQTLINTMGIPTGVYLLKLGSPAAKETRSGRFVISR